MQNWDVAGNHGDGLRSALKARLRNGDGVIADGNDIEAKFSVLIGLSLQSEIGIRGL